MICNVQYFPTLEITNSNKQQDINSCLFELSRDINFWTVWCRLESQIQQLYFTPLVVRNFK
jgi:hypothetical protein